MLKKIVIGFLAVIAMVAAVVIAAGWLVGSAILFDRPEVAEPVAIERPAVLPIFRPSAASTSAPISNSKSMGKQLLFGDLHVHTSFSFDAALFDTPAVKGTGYTTPTDACDYARYCSALDFWSINDHAESLTAKHWSDTKEAIRQCNAVTDPNNPDLVSFLGWEWTQGSTNPKPEVHYGHKNVILRDIEEAQVPTRAIGSDTDNIIRQASLQPAVIRGLALLGMSQLNLTGYTSLAEHLATLSAADACGAEDVRALPDNCYETAANPTRLFEKLDQWGFDAMVIPHGLAWGVTNPVGADFNYQMPEHNAKYQRLLEMNSGHGNSEVYRELNMPMPGDAICPAPENGYTPCCWQAGEIIRHRCQANGNDAAACNPRAEKTRGMYLAALDGVSQLSQPREVVPGTVPNDWGMCDQLVGEFQASYYYQPKQSAQYTLTLGEEGKRFRPGFIGSSDNHSARPGNSYKEFDRIYMTDVKESAIPGVTVAKTAALRARAQPEADQPVIPEERLFTDEEDLANAFYFTAGLVAVHSTGRDRDAIWEALHRREVYGTSGPRIGLWFDMIEGQKIHPMGSEVRSAETPVFRIKAMGSIKQNPGCPDFATQALGSERIESLCRNECFNPSNESHNIVRIEVIKVLPRMSADELTTDLIKDPWRVLHCKSEQSSCEAEFSDNSFVQDGREAAYYARAIQEATPTIQGDSLACEYNEAGVCVKANLCLGDGPANDCLSLAEHRAWSSPIYVMPTP